MTGTFVDAGVLIAAFRAADALGRAALAIVDDPDREFVASAFLQLEVVPKATYYRRAKELAFYQAFFAGAVAWAPPSDPLVTATAREAAVCGMNALDALHVATAVLFGAAELVTAEGPTKPIHRTTSVRVLGI